MAMSASSVRSPRPTSVASYQGSSPRLPSPLNSSPNLLSLPLTSGHTPYNSPVGDTLSPLRERPDTGFTSPRSPPAVARPRTSSFSRSPLSNASPEQSPSTGSLPLQQHHAYTRHPSPCGSPFAQGIPFPSSSPLSSSPLAGQSQSLMPLGPRPLSPSNSLGQGSPASIHSNRSQLQSRSLRSALQPTQSHFRLSQGSSVQVAHVRTQSLIQQSFGNSYAAQVASSPPDCSRDRRASLGAEPQPCPPTPSPASPSFVQDNLTYIKGDSTPLNEAPVRWWSGQRGWTDDWDNVMYPSQVARDPHTTHLSGRNEPEDAMGMGFPHPGHGDLLGFREPFGQGVNGPGPFLDDEIRASFDGVGARGVGFSAPLTPNVSLGPMGPGPGCGMEGVPVSRAVPVPLPLGSTRSRNRDDNLAYGELNVGPPPVDGALAIQKTPDNLTCNLCHFHSHGCMGKFAPDGVTPVQDQESAHDGRGHEHAGGCNRRFSNASIHSSTSYVSGPSRSQSRSVLVFPSQSRTNVSPSLRSLGIGIEEAEREELRSRSFWKRRSSVSTVKRQSKDLSHSTSGHNEDLGQECRFCRTVRNGEKDGLAHADSRECECPNRCKAGVTGNQSVDSKHSATHAVKHGSMFFRGGLKHEDALQEDAQREGYNRAEKYVSLAITSILPATTIMKLSPVGEALVKARESVKFAGHELAPVVKDTLVVSTDILSLVPLPGLEEAAKALLSVWNACQKVDTNRLSCLRLAERCAALLYSVRLEINEAGLETAIALDEPVERLCGALTQIRSFLETQLHRPFLKRYVRREEIARDLVACNEAITDAASKFGISVQIRTYHVVCSAANESKRFAQELQALLSLDQQMMRRHYAMMYGQPMQTWRREVVGFSNDNVLGLTMDATLMGATSHLHGASDEKGNGDGSGGSRLTPPPPYGPLPQPSPSIAGSLSAMCKLESTGSGSKFKQNTQTSSMISTGYPSDVTEPAVSVPPTPTPSKATFIVEQTRTKGPTSMTTMHPTSPMRALVQMHWAQDSVDAAADEVALRGTLACAMGAKNDVEMIRCLQVGRGEIPEAAETLRRMLGTSANVGMDGDEPTALEGEVDNMDMGSVELHRRFMQIGIEAMARLASVVTKQPRDGDQQVGLCEGAGALGAPELPSWTITRYEVTRTRKIGVGFFSDVYLGHWQNRPVVVKVLAHSVSREAFVRHVELWNTLDHQNVLPLYGASSAVGEKPWFFVSKFCSGGNLVEWLKCARVMAGETMSGNEAATRVDLLRCMHDIAKGMAYLHGRGVLHGHLRAVNVLVDENGQCVLSDFGQHGIRSEAHRSCGKPERRLPQWEAPEILRGGDQPTSAADIYAFATCCIEILGMGDLPWASLDDKAIHELVLDKDERPPIPMFAGCVEVTSAIENLVRSCWAREPDHRSSFASIVASLEEICRLHGHDDPHTRRHSLTPQVSIRSALAPSTESSPAEEQYETASESMSTEVEEEDVSGMMDVPLTSPAPALGHCDVVGSVVQVPANDHTEFAKVLTQVSSVVVETQEEEMPTPSPTNELSVDMRREENYRLIIGSSHAFHSSLTLPLWSPTRVELGAVGYLSKLKGEFITLFNAIDPLQSSEDQLRHLPSMYGYGKFEIQKREDGKRSMAQRGLDAISGFLTFKTRNDRSHSERIARQYTFPLVEGKPAAYLCVEKTVHRYMDHLEAPTMWFGQHVDRILEVCAPRHAIEREDLILVIGTLDAPDWALFVSEDHSDGRAHFNVFSGREKGEPWGMYTVERVVKSGNGGQAQWVDVGQGMLASKVSSVTLGGHDAIGDTVMLAGLRLGCRRQGQW